MSVRRSQNWVNQQRVDVPHLRSIESAVRNDFDELLGAFAIGSNSSHIIRGFEINMTAAIGATASSLQMIVEDSAMLHGTSNEAGTFFQIAAGTANQVLNSTTNTRVDGTFSPSSLNYVGLEFTRAIDNSTAAQVFLWNPTTKTEISKNIPLAETLDYKIVITNSLWAPNVVPVAIVKTDTSNNVVSVEDRRSLLYRLGSAGASTPDPTHQYPWTNHSESRSENFWKSTSSTSPFRGGDKQLLHFKEWADAVMSMLVEVKGTTYWYSPISESGSLLKLRGDLDRTYITGNGKYTHNSSTAGQLNWDSNIFLNFIGSRLSYKILSNAATTDLTLSDNQVAYLELTRDQDIGPNLIFTNGSAIVNSVGASSWTSSLLAGDFIKIATENDSQYYEILSVNTPSQVTLTTNFAGTSTDPVLGAQAKYALGTYETNPAPSTNRHIQIANREDVPFSQDVFWLYFRNDNGGATPQIFIRGSSGGELEQGEDRGISDNTSIDVLNYIGSPEEDATAPDYNSQTQAAGSLAGQSYNSSNGENLTLRLAKVTAMLADHKQDFNIDIDPGMVTWDGTNITIDNAQLSIPGTTIGAAPVAINNLASTALPVNEALYVDINRTTAGSLTLAQAALGSLTPSQQRLVVARNIGGNLLVG